MFLFLDALCGSFFVLLLENMDPEASAEDKTAQVQKMLEEGNQANFIRFDGLDHMISFNYAYDLEAVRDWLFAQSK